MSSLDDLAVRDTDTGAELSLGGSSLATLNGIAADQVTADLFIFTQLAATEEVADDPATPTASNEPTDQSSAGGDDAAAGDDSSPLASQDDDHEGHDDDHFDHDHHHDDDHDHEEPRLRFEEEGDDRNHNHDDGHLHIILEPHWTDDLL